MAPFPESEDMTIRRLIVALRKSDMQLLRMGAYKLHEKFHTGYDFESTEELKKILDFIQEKPIPNEISELLNSTIREILLKKGIDFTPTKKPIPEPVQEPVTQAHVQEPVREFVQPIQPVQTPPVQPAQQTYVQTSMQDDISQIASQLHEEQNLTMQELQDEEDMEFEANEAAQAQPAVLQKSISQIIHEKSAPSPQHLPPLPQAPTLVSVQDEDYLARMGLATSTQNADMQPAEPKKDIEIAVFYDDQDCKTDYAKVKEYRNGLNLLFQEGVARHDFDVLKQIASITHTLDTKIADLSKILLTLNTSKAKATLVTTSQSQNITKILMEKSMDFEIPFVKKPISELNSLTLIPMLGFTNIFVCSNCNTRTLKTDSNARTLSVQCPRCEGASVPDVYAVNSYNPDCNPIFWHRAFAAFIRSKVWILVNPPLDENKEIVFDFIKTAYACAQPDTIYILCKETDKKEFYKQTLLAINPHCDIRHNYSQEDKLCEDFINQEITKKVLK